MLVKDVDRFIVEHFAVLPKQLRGVSPVNLFFVFFAGLLIVLRVIKALFLFNEIRDRTDRAAPVKGVRPSQCRGEKIIKRDRHSLFQRHELIYR